MCRTLCSLVVPLLVVGCAPDPRDIVDYSNEPIGMQLLRAEPMLKQRKFNTLLDFESPNDLVFVGTQPAAVDEVGVGDVGHGGKSSALRAAEKWLRSNKRATARAKSR